MFSLIKRFFTIDGMMKKQEVFGELPNTKELYRNLINVAWPATVESVLVGLVGFVNTMMVSVLGARAIAAVGLTNQPRLLFYAVFFALNISVTAVVSRRKGQGDREGANSTLAQAISLSVVLAVVLSLIGILVAEPFMRLAGANDETIADSVKYFRIVIAGMVFTAVSGVINSAQRSIGNTRIALTSNLAANIVNVIFAYLLISGHCGFPALGILGDAIPAVMGSMVACGMSVWSVRRNGYLRLSFKECLKFRPELLKPLLKVGMGAGVEQTCIRIGFFTYSATVANLGTAAFATHQICMNIINLSFTFGDGLGMASSALVGQNLGKKRADLSSLYGKAGQRVGFFVSLFLVLLFSFGGKMLLGLFVAESDENYDYIMQNGIIIMYIIAVVCVAQITQVIYNGCLRGAGDTKYVAVVSTISIMIVRPILTYLFCYTFGMGLIGAWISLVVDQVARLVFSAKRFSGGKWEIIKV
jgi:putative MATE family efflux protein